MSNVCSGCQKQFGRFTGSRPLHENSSLVFCDNCDRKFRVKLNAVNANATSAKFDEKYQDFVSAVRTSGFPDQVKLQMIEEIEELYKDSLPDRQKAVKEREILGVDNDDLEHWEPGSFMMTTGYNFEGHDIKKYLGVVSDGVVQGTGWLSELSADFNDFFGTESNTFARKMEYCRKAALKKIYTKAKKLNANAMIGISYETMTFRNNMIGIMATGTAVLTEKQETQQ